MIETGRSKRLGFGYNLRTFSLVLLAAGLMAVVALWLSTTRLWSDRGWRAWAALVTAGLLGVVTYATVCAFRRRWLTLAVVFATIAAASLGLVPARNRFLPWTTIEGRVVYGSTGLPAVGVTVHLQPTHTSLTRAYGPPSGDERFALACLLSGGSKVITDAEGRYCFRSVPFADYNVWVTHRDWTVEALDSLNTTAGAVTVAGDLRLLRGGLIKGRVTDVSTGRQVQPSRAMNWADAVMLYGPSRPAGGAVESVMIQPDGSFEIRAAPGMNHLYVNGARDDPRCPREITVEVREGETIEVDLPTLWAER